MHFSHAIQAVGLCTRHYYIGRTKTGNRAGRQFRNGTALVASTFGSFFCCFVAALTRISFTPGIFLSLCVGDVNRNPCLGSQWPVIKQFSGKSGKFLTPSLGENWAYSRRSSCETIYIHSERRKQPYQIIFQCPSTLIVLRMTNGEYQLSVDINKHFLVFIQNSSRKDFRLELAGASTCWKQWWQQ